MKREASKYFYIRENSIEWNEPYITFGNGGCCGFDPCLYTLQDNLSVVYFDDPVMNKISNSTPICNEIRTCTW